MQIVTRDTLIDSRYRVLNRVGTGGMAEVWCAEDQQLGRRVALKLLSRRFAEDPEFVERFRREASSAAGLQHPNIVQVFDRGEWDGTYYIAMEFLEGRSLKAVVREEGPLDPDRAIDIALQVLKAARFAHKRGIVHRDIKPHNVILDAEGRAKVTDFGIARAGASDITETGSIMGTAQYLSPEQAQGQPVDARADIYSIGILLYELLTGRVPFDGESAVTIALKQVSAPPLPPSQLNPAVSPALEAVVLRALAKAPARRFQDAGEFSAALEQARAEPSAVDSTQVGMEAYPMPDEPFPPGDERERRRRRRWPWIVLLLVALVALGVGAFLLLRPEKIEVPDVVGDRTSVAAQRLQNAGFEPEIETATFADVRRDRVATQDPQPGERAKEGSTVKLIVSSGPGQVAVPDVLDATRRDAERRLERAGFKVSVRQEFDDDVRRGRVIETRPAPGQVTDRGRTVVVVVSRGPREVEVPDLRELDRDGAERALEERELRPIFREEETDAEDPGEVLRQDPAPGTKLQKGEDVTVVVATEPREEDVPDVVDLAVNDALDELQQAGFRVRTQRRTVDTPDEDDVVLEQNPPAGSRRERGSRVTVVVGRFEPADLNPDPTPTPTP